MRSFFSLKFLDLKRVIPIKETNDSLSLKRKNDYFEISNMS